MQPSPYAVYGSTAVHSGGSRVFSTLLGIHCSNKVLALSTTQVLLSSKLECVFLVIVGVVIKVGMSLQDTPNDREEINTVVIHITVKS